MTNEAQLDHFEHLVDAYAAMRVYHGKVEDVERRIESWFVEQAENSPTFDSIQRVTGRQRDVQVELPSRIAWNLQQVLNARAYCVRNRIVHARENRKGSDYQYQSPLLDQIRLGREIDSSVDLGSIFDRRKELQCRKIIDALLIDPSQSKLYVVVGLPFVADMERHDADDAVLPLFNDVHGVTPEGSGLSGLKVDGAHVSAAMLASEMLATACPAYRVIPLVVVAQDPQFGNRFQAHSIERATIYPGANESVCLDQFEVVASSALWRMQGGDTDDLNELPDWPARDRLNNLPVDRAARCMKMLNLHWERQLRSPDHLVARTWRELGEDVQRHYNIAYTVDLRRHDVEDCLERHGYVERLTYDPKKFALTPRGVARALLTRRLFAMLDASDFDNGIGVNILGHIHSQASAWARYRDGLSKATQ